MHRLFVNDFVLAFLSSRADILRRLSNGLPISFLATRSGVSKLTKQQISLVLTFDLFLLIQFGFSLPQRFLALYFGVHESLLFAYLFLVFDNLDYLFLFGQLLLS